MQRSQSFRNAILLLSLLLLYAAPATGEEADHVGWYFAVEAASTTPGNVDTPLLSSAPSLFAVGGSTDLETNVEYTDFDSGFTGAVTFGYSWGSSGRLQVTFWDYSEEEDASGFSAYYPNRNFFTIGPLSAFDSYAYGYYSSFNDVSFDMTQELEATTVDVEYMRPVQMESENLTVTWGIGLRYASFEDEVEGQYVLDPTGFAARYPVTREIESDGIGLTGSVGVNYDFLDSIIGISSNLRVGFILSDVDANHSITDLDGYYSNYLTFSQSVSMEDEVATTIDFEGNLVFHASENVDFDIGWFYSTWAELPEVALSRTTATFLVEGAPSIPGEDRDRISFSGPKARARFRF
jgi:hypothetical protein